MQDRRYHRNTFGPNQFQLKGEDRARTIDAHFVNKYAKEWNLTLLSPEDDPETFYKDIKRCVGQYNVLLKKYHDITKLSGVEAITPDNCDNYDQASEAMSRTLYSMFPSPWEFIANFGSRNIDPSECQGEHMILRA